MLQSADLQQTANAAGLLVPAYKDERAMCV